MEVYLYNSTVCRLCGEENDNGSLLYTPDENNQSLSDIINTYLPLKVSDDGELPRTICPGCTIQIEATVEFINLIVNGQKIIRELHLREREYKKTLVNTANANNSNIITENIVYEINTSDGVYQVEHPIALQVAGLERPKRKRGRPPKKPRSPEEEAREAAARQRVEEARAAPTEADVPGKRRRKTPTRFKEAVQGKELERIFKEEGVTDGEESGGEAVPEQPREPEVIGHLEASGELVVVVKGKGRGRPKGRMRPTREVCAICGMEFSCVGRYMSHVAAHGPVTYRCSCGVPHDTRLALAAHQRAARHSGHSVQPHDQENATKPTAEKPEQELSSVEEVVSNAQETVLPAAVPDAGGAPDAAPAPDSSLDVEAQVADKPEATPAAETPAPEPAATAGAPGKPKLPCGQCDKVFSNKQSRSLHVKAVHEGLKPYTCAECGVSFAYPRSLALHALSHRRQQSKGFACDLCGKVLNHPSSVVYHKEAEHAGQRYVCGKCGKLFKHKQLLQRHQLVHSQARPYSCKICGTSFKTKANLLNHSLLHSGVKRFACELCKHRFAHKTSLTLHMRWHTGLKPYSCSTCGKSFSQKGNLSEHARIHTGEKPYQCGHCPRRFTTSSQHRLHARRHDADQARPVACTHCDKRFACRASYAAHMRRAARGARHRCTVCGRAFAERWALLKHARRHTGERPHRCPLCPRAFADASNLNKHKKHVHKQVSLLLDKNVPPPPERPPERIVYVAYDAPSYSVVTTEQMEVLPTDKALPCALYAGPSLLLPQPAALPEVQMEQQLELTEPIVLEESVELEEGDHMPVTDEQGNPLHFTMQDGTRLAITSVDGKSLQVITQDGQTIPVEINGFAEEEEVENQETIVHRVNIQKTVDATATPVAHYFTIV